jgi:hypothetical protein
MTTLITGFFRFGGYRELELEFDFGVCQLVEWLFFVVYLWMKQVVSQNFSSVAIDT